MKKRTRRLTFYRWLRRYGLKRLMKKIHDLPETVHALGKQYTKLPNTFVIY